MSRITDQTYELKSGYPIPVLGLGTWALTGAVCEKAVSIALELGYRHIDTAELYGNEIEIGKAIKKADRSELFITSKVSSSNLRTRDLIDACHASLDRLGTDYLDLYLVHWPNDTIPLEKTMEGMQKLVDDGRIRSVGLSNFDVKRMQAAVSLSRPPICNNQVEYHPYRPRYEIPRFCWEHGITLTAYCPLARGKILGDTTLRNIGRQYGKSPAQVSLRWLLQKGAIVIPKASSREHLNANIDLDGWELSAEDIEAIDSLSVENKLVDTRYT
jgi:diketogulonate reductase-like aldo/keto reductase